VLQNTPLPLPTPLALHIAKRNLIDQSSKDRSTAPQSDRSQPSGLGKEKAFAIRGSRGMSSLTKG
jgi:hypothetical protein